MNECMYVCTYVCACIKYIPVIRQSSLRPVSTDLESDEPTVADQDMLLLRSISASSGSCSPPVHPRHRLGELGRILLSKLPASWLLDFSSIGELQRMTAKEFRRNFL